MLSYILILASIKGLISKIYPWNLLLDIVYNYIVFVDYTILSTRNNIVWGLNIAILVQFPSQSCIYLLINSADINNTSNHVYQIPIEFLETINIPNLLLANLELKIGVLIMILRNLNLQEGLYNRTCLVVTALYKYSI